MKNRTKLKYCKNKHQMLETLIINFPLLDNWKTDGHAASPKEPASPICQTTQPLAAGDSWETLAGGFRDDHQWRHSTFLQIYSSSHCCLEDRNRTKCERRALRLALSCKTTSLWIRVAPEQRQWWFCISNLAVLEFQQKKLLTECYLYSTLFRYHLTQVKLLKEILA